MEEVSKMFWEPTLLFAGSREERRGEGEGKLRGRRARCHGVLGRRCQVTQKKTREAKRQQTREEWVDKGSRKGNWGDKRSQERRSGDER